MIHIRYPIITIMAANAFIISSNTQTLAAYLEYSNIGLYNSYHSFQKLSNKIIK